MYTDYNSKIKFALISTYEYYDRPVMFSCHIPSMFSLVDKEHYLAILIDDGHDDSGFWEAFMYVRVSDERFASFHNNEIEIRDMFLEAEAGFVLVALYLRDRTIITDWTASEIPDELLSLPGIYLSKEASTTQV